jgi:hypothetical protein
MNGGASLRNTLSPAIVVAAILTIAWFAYKPALGGTFLLDDFSNLGGLSTVNDTDSAVQFVLSGSAGPLGRPLALASFLPQASAWGSDAAPFLRVNILIHMMNGLLLFAFLSQLLRELRHTARNSLYIASAATAIWLLMPLLASSSLLIVQRMTTMSAMFVLAGLNGYMLARRRLDTEPRAALTGMGIAIVLAAMLAVLSKENGALLPIYVLVLETTLLRPPQSLSNIIWKAWRGFFLWSPALVIVVFLVSQVPYPDNTVASRDFTAAGRLSSEARILWEYLFNAFFSWGGNLGPFHESRQAHGHLSTPWTWLAMLAWFSVLAAAIRWRRSYPVPAFAALWFLAGHLLESTTIPLELYFEHRNYLPIIGPVFALCYLALRVSGRFRAISRVALSAYAVANGFVLIGVTSLWGSPLLAATQWYEQDPGSVRAATTLASQQLSRAGPDLAIRTLQDFAARNTQYAFIRIPELNLNCAVAPHGDHSELVKYLESALPFVAFSLTTGEMLDQLLSTSVSRECKSVSPNVVAKLADAVMENPRYNGNVRYLQFHHTLLARSAKVSGDTDATLDHLARAIDAMPSDDLNMMVVTTLAAADRFGEARQFIEDATGRLSHRPLRRYKSKRNLAELMIYVDESEKLAGDRHESSNGD